jgi:DNA polymerase-3 subunit epsilon
MRQIILDTETTGLDPALGHRIIEIAGVELASRRLTDNHFHRYVNPGRESEEGALQVHGLTAEFLRDKPKFNEIVDEFLDYVNGAELIIHNAPFDVAFLNHELDLLGRKSITSYCPGIVDTLRMAKDVHPGKKNSLDALCERYQVDNAARTLHGALLDAQLLAEVYLAMTRGQESLAIEVEHVHVIETALDAAGIPLDLIVLAAGENELAAHLQTLAEIDKASGGSCVWKHLDALAISGKQ